MTQARFYYRDPTAPTPNRPRSLGASIALLSDDDSQVLLEYRSDSDYWAPISGSADPDETVTQCIHREVKEETGRALVECTFVGFITDPTRIAAFPDGNIVNVCGGCYLGRLEPGPLVISAESRELRWFAWDDVPWDQVAPTVRPVLELARRRLADPSFIYVD